jgi:hypothetical protein
VPLLAWDIFSTFSVLMLFPLSVLSLLAFIVSLFPRFSRFRAISFAFFLSAAVAIAISVLDPGRRFVWLMTKVPANLTPRRLLA